MVPAGQVDQCVSKAWRVRRGNSPRPRANLPLGMCQIKSKLGLFGPLGLASRVSALPAGNQAGRRPATSRKANMAHMKEEGEEGWGTGNGGGKVKKGKRRALKGGSPSPFPASPSLLFRVPAEPPRVLKPAHAVASSYSSTQPARRDTSCQKYSFCSDFAKYLIGNTTKLFVFNMIMLYRLLLLRFLCKMAH